MELINLRDFLGYANLTGAVLNGGCALDIFLNGSDSKIAGIDAIIPEAANSVMYMNYSAAGACAAATVGLGMMAYHLLSRQKK